MGCCGIATRIETARINGRVATFPDVAEDYPGANATRVCRDVIFLVFFCVFAVFGIGLIIYAASKGGVERTLGGSDEYGNVCGKNNEQLFGLSESGKDFSSKKFYVADILNLNTYNTLYGVSFGECTDTCPVGYDTFGFKCIPSTGIATTGINNQIKGFFDDIGEDMNECWGHVVACCLIAFLFSLIITFLLRFLAAIIVWVSVIVMIVASFVLTLYLWATWSQLKSKIETEIFNGNSNNVSAADEQKKQHLLFGAIIVTILTILLIILIIALRKRILLVIALFKEAGKVVAAMPLILLQPVWTCMVMLIACVIWAVGWVLLQTSADPVLVSEVYVGYQISDFMKGMQLYHMFGYFWATQFIIGCQHVVIAGAVAKWFFTRDKSKLGWPILASMKILIKYSLGSVAFGSFIIAVIKLIRYLMKRAQKRMGTTSACGTFLKVCNCCMGCFEKILKYITKNAYIVVAIYGYSFCKSAQKAFSILTSNALRVTAINLVGSFVLFLAKAAVVVSTVFASIAILNTLPNLKQMWFPVAIVGLFSFLIVHCFISVYEMIIDSLFICFCEDCEMNDGISRPYFMSKGLMEFVENSKKALEQLEKKKYEKKNANQMWVQPVNPANSNQVSRAPSSVMLQPTPRHRIADGSVENDGMTPLQAQYPPRSLPPTPSKLRLNTIYGN